METPRDKIVMIVDRLGMSTEVAAKAMNIREQTFRANRRGTSSRNYFSEKNYTDLLDFIISEMEYLITYSFVNTKNADAYVYVADLAEKIFEDYPISRKKKGYSLFDELKTVVSYMETSEVFSDMEIYSEVIDDLIKKSAALENELNFFSIRRYNDYACKGKKKEHTMWIAFMDYRRRKAVKEVLKRNITIEP
ncbi:hypothetical protein HNP37_002111 [Flavobacterium nitrogenifigens]|uniref:Uncharacterized protein n=2 Tax=Flavobacterium TaxID=237 RepID=A0A7W7IY89_9FLAO|nr:MULTISPECIES: hypothetical protein [Flavobacterium]MBB4802050.1 hypothetical protein [Flavobacterium nitrogenifigens]MBB6387008.1 hypothetical protein [Flavobacterium notoginsengisoli]